MDKKSNMTANDVKKELKKVAHHDKALILSRFFKIGPGQYGEGDKFLGIKVPEQRVIVKKYAQLSLTEIQKLLNSEWHEERLTGALILVQQFTVNQTDEATRQQIFDFYLKNTARFNNWDLVDLSADKIVGEWLYTHPDLQLLNKLKSSKIIWERRIAVLATFAFIKHGDDQLIYQLAPDFFSDKEDLIHKAVGWMLREAGKRVSEANLLKFLDQHATAMPRTMLRYAIERLLIDTRLFYLKAK